LRWCLISCRLTNCTPVDTPVDQHQYQDASRRVATPLKVSAEQLLLVALTKR
jgi:hypothetical protein